MNIIDRYLKSVGRHLPLAQRDDIVKELGENIRSEIDDKESELGRPLTEAEQETILRQHGNPILVAGRYRQDHRSVAFGRQWIGPILFPFYIYVLRFNLGISFAVVFTIYIAMFAARQNLTLSGILEALFLQLIIQFGIITAIFATVDAYLAKYPDRWDPRKTSPTLVPPFMQSDDTGKSPRVSRFDSIAHLIAWTIGLAWLRAVQHAPFLIFGPAAGALHLAPIWQQIYWPSIIVILAEILQASINLVQPAWTTFRSAMRTATGLISLGIVFAVIRAGEWVMLSNPSSGATGLHDVHAIEIINQVFYYSLWFAGLIVLVTLVRDVRRLVGPRTARPNGVIRAS